MKYFTRELLEQFRSKDEEVAEIASDKWDEAAEDYAGYLRSVWSQLLPSVRQLLENHYLHDAEVVFAGREDQGYFVTVKLDVPPKDSLLLRYELAAAPEIIRHEANVLTHGPVQWLYDEVEVVHKGLFRHSILLTNGCELQLDFRDFSSIRVANQQVLVSGTCSYGVSQVA